MIAVLSRPGAELTAVQLHDLLRLRVDVFVVEQKSSYPEIDGQDLLASTRHFWIPGELDGTNPKGIAGCLRMLAEPGGVVRIGRVCTAVWARGTGLGVRLMTAAMDVAGNAECVLHSQTYVQDFYARFGFRTEGDEFDDDGIMHITMRRPAAPPQ